MFKIAGGIILAVIGLYLLAIALQLLPIALLMAPDFFRAGARAATPTRETLYVLVFYVVGIASGLWLLARPGLARFRTWLNSDAGKAGKPISWH